MRPVHTASPFIGLSCVLLTAFACFSEERTGANDTPDALGAPDMPDASDPPIVECGLNDECPPGSLCELNERVCREHPDGEQAVTQLVGGGGHTCLLLGVGAVRCWGSNGDGRLGYGNPSDIGDDEFPSIVGDVDVGGRVVQLSLGGTHTCALLDTGSVRCWGGGANGQLGYGDTNNIGDDEQPASVGDVDLGATAVQLAAGRRHTCAVTDAGAVRCWGVAGDGRLGYGNIENIGDDETPATAGDVDIGGTVVQLASGGFHTCALLDSGSVRCWGRGTEGQLGYGDTNHIGDNESPASAGDVDVGGAVVQLSARTYHTCARLDTGAVRCWGEGLGGKLGYGNSENIGDDETPASVSQVDIGGDVVQISAGGRHTCALLDRNAVRCWGEGLDGQLGYGNINNIGDNEAPMIAGDVDVGGAVVRIASGGSHTCALMETGAVRCWGVGGRLGYGNSDTIGDDEPPASVGDVPFR